jgi:hypothetical protein
MIGYFIYKREYSFGEWKRCVRKRTFWINVFFTILIISGGFILMILIQNHFQSVPLGEFKIKSDTPFKLFLFWIQTIILPPLAEEIFYRKYLIIYGSKKQTAFTILISSLLFAAEHALYPFGIVTYMIFGIAFGLAYLRNKNIYVMITAHFLINIFGNGIPTLMVLLG